VNVETLNHKETECQDAPLLSDLDPEERKAILRGQLALIVSRASLGLPTEQAISNPLKVAA